MPSCRSTKHVPEGEYLLKKVKFDTDNKDLDKDNLNSTLKQKPNRKTLFFIKFHLGVYNVFKTEKNKNFLQRFSNRIAEVVGEPPVIYDKDETERSIINMNAYLQSQSYYEANVEYKTKVKKLNKKKIVLTYMINSGEPYIINKFDYDISDPKIMELVMLDTVNSLVKTKDKLNTEILQSERDRLVRMLKSNGYYYFSINNIHYYADSTKNKYEAELTLAIRKSFQEENINSDESFVPQTIRNIYIYPDYNSQLYLSDEEAYKEHLDTLFIDGYKIIYYDGLKIKPTTLLQSCFVSVGDWYSIQNIEKTHSHFSSLKQFRLINIRLNAPEDVVLETQKERFLDMHIYLTPLKRRSYSVELEGSNTSGNIGMAGVITYNNRNLLRGAQNLSIRGLLSFQSLTSVIDDNKVSFFNTLEYGGEIKLNIPRLMIPFFENYEFVKNHNPHTRISTSFNFQQRPEYSRSITNAAFGYVWKGGKNNYITHSVNPIDLYVVKILKFDPDFLAEISNSFLKFSYEDQLLTVISYNLLFNNQNINKSQNFSMLWFNVETSGNIPAAIYKLADRPKVNDSYRFLGIEFSQFVKTDLDYRFYQIFNEKHRMVYRAYFGIGIPYGNSTKGLPFIKKYFIGGANDLRAWRVRTLGPGSYETSSTIEQNGDMKLVLNMEYRFKMISFLNGALFLDAGNIWSINKKNDERQGALFEWNRFYKEIALGTGFGLRLDFSFFLIRLDFGVPLYDPQNPEGKRWIGSFRNFQIKDLTLNFGINYPF
jgi:outer membrane protein assembly factor BamA